jgi:hypothetical protein
MIYGSAPIPSPSERRIGPHYRQDEAGQAKTTEHGFIDLTMLRIQCRISPKVIFCWLTTSRFPVPGAVGRAMLGSLLFVKPCGPDLRLIGTAAGAAKSKEDLLVASQSAFDLNDKILCFPLRNPQLGHGVTEIRTIQKN